jgi:hypothetical protein
MAAINSAEDYRRRDVAKSNTALAGLFGRTSCLVATLFFHEVQLRRGPHEPAAG